MSAPQPQSIDVPVYLLVEPTWSEWSRDDSGRPVLTGGKVVKATQKKPSVPREGVAVKITLRVPASAFLPLQPEAVVVLRESDAETIVVEASDPSENEETP